MKCSLLVLSSYLDGELEAGRGGELEAHLLGCTRCREGLDWLHEEVDRVGALARAHVPDHSAHAVFEQLGLLGPSDPLPPRAHFDPEPSPGIEILPWLRGEQGKALPWTARRRGRSTDPAPTGPDEHPTSAALASHIETRELGRGGTPGGGADIELAGARSVAAPPRDPQVFPRPLVPGGFAAFRPGEAAGTRSGSTAEDSPAEPSGVEAGPAPASPAAPAPPTQRPAADVDDLPRASPRESVPISHGAMEVTPTESPFTEIPAGQTELFNLDRSRPAATPSSSPLARPRPAAGPIPAHRGLVGQVREQFALRRALSRAARREFDDSVQIVSGHGAPLTSARSRVRTEREANRRAGSANTSSGEDELELGAAAHGEPQSRPRRSATMLALRERARSAAPRAIVPGGGAAVEAVRRRISVGGAGAVSRRADAVASATPAAASRRRITDAPAIDRRPLAAFGVAAALVLALGLTVGRSTTPAPRAAVTAQPSLHPGSGAVVLPAPAVPKVSTPAQPSAALGSPVTVGDTGSGYRVAGIRYAAHPGNFRVVFDLGGAGQGVPRATVVQPNANTLRVELFGVGGSLSLGALTVSDPVTTLTLVQPSPLAGAVVYDLHLSRAVTPTVSFVGSPLRLVLDLQ